MDLCILINHRIHFSETPSSCLKLQIRLNNMTGAQKIKSSACTVVIQLYPGYIGSAAPISLRPKSQGSVVSEIATRHTDLSEHNLAENMYSTYN